MTVEDERWQKFLKAYNAPTRTARPKRCVICGANGATKVKWDVNLPMVMHKGCMGRLDDDIIAV